MAKLERYESKRRRGKTPEPFAVAAARSDQRIFVVQRHAARRLHYDFRLERDGVLASWAVPKGLPLEPGERRLAVHVEDHPLAYADFEGEIPAGQYGAGSVEIWDRGSYRLLEEKKDGGLTVELSGRRLQGVWTLVPAQLSGEEKNWLLLRKHEQGGEPRQPAGPLPYRPMLATLVEEIPRGRGWLFEVKWDGYRALALLAAGKASFVSRQGNDFDRRFQAVARALEQAVRTPSCVLDGELCALDERGRGSFSAMQQNTGQLVFYAFDLLELEGKPLVGLPFSERRSRLKELLAEGAHAVRLSETFKDGEALLVAAREQGVEGVIAKRSGSPYASGKRSRDWLKIKAHGRQEFVIAGYTRGRGSRANSFGALVLAVRQGPDLRYVGNCGTGFTRQEIERLSAKLRPLERRDSPFPTPPKMAKVRREDVVWVDPRLVCEVRFAEWTHDGRLRAPSYQGLREDKPPEQVRTERPIQTEIRRGSRTLRLASLDKLFWPQEGITKGDLLAYYRAVAPVLLSHLKHRPFTMKRYPDGWQGEHFFQKDAPSHMPEWIPRRKETATSRETGHKRTVAYPLVNDELALLWMVNMGCIDMNVWTSRVDRPDRPDFALFDLDPSPEAGFAEAVQVARLVKEALDQLGLAGFPKTSGVDGIHVLVPIARRHSYDDTRSFVEVVASALERTHRGLVTTEWSKAKRRGVLIDVNQNARGKTLASAYSVRPRAGAPVSTPLRWDELGESLDPRAFTMEAVLGRLARHGDLFEPVLTMRQSLRRALASLS